jgi:hypothetical protein
MHIILFEKVRWSSTFEMLDRFCANRQAISVLAAHETSLPRFTNDDWTMLSALRKVIFVHPFSYFVYLCI